MNAADELFDRLTEIQAGRRLPPVSQWQPERVGAIDIRIARDGTWYHEGDPILRQPLVDLFATILRKDGDRFWLVTPAEKLAIVVEDAPFLAVDLVVKGSGTDQQLLFTTNVGDHVPADADHPIRLAGTPEQPRPYLHVRDGLEALIVRNVYYRIAELCDESDGRYWIRSAGVRFALG
jgi:hypothetical protein